MLITRGDRVCGIDAVQLRTAFRGRDVISASELAQLLRLSPSVALKLVNDLLAGGYLDGAPVSVTPSGQSCYLLSPRGSALAAARIGRPIPRTKAESLLAGVVSRARAVNAVSDCPCFVAGLAVYGSYQRGASKVGDIDIACLILDRCVPGQDKVDRCFSFARKHGRDRSWADGFLFGLRWVRHQLKERSPYISIMDPGDPVALGVQADEIFAARWDREEDVVTEEPPGDDWANRVKTSRA